MNLSAIAEGELKQGMKLKLLYLVLSNNLKHAKDSTGAPLLRKEVDAIWNEQKRHCYCIVDPEGVSLYRITGQTRKGSSVLPVYRCARGSNSLESFHLHINQMIPSNAMNAVNMQALLLDGIVRWNSDRAAEAFGKVKLMSSDVELVERVKKHTGEFLVL